MVEYRNQQFQEGALTKGVPDNLSTVYYDTRVTQIMQPYSELRDTNKYRMAKQALRKDGCRSIIKAVGLP